VEREARSKAWFHNVGQAQSSGPGVTVEGRTASAEPYETIVERARRLLEWQVEQIRESGGTVVETHLRIGSPPTRSWA
jgi:hypothetical protein